MLHYRSWCKAIDTIMTGLNSSLLVRDPETHVSFKFVKLNNCYDWLLNFVDMCFFLKEFLINFDPQVQELIKETAYFRKMNLAIPETAKELIILDPKIEKHIVE